MYKIIFENGDTRHVYCGVNDRIAEKFLRQISESEKFKDESIEILSPPKGKINS